MAGDHCFSLGQKINWPEMIENPFNIMRSSYNLKSFCVSKIFFWTAPPTPCTSTALLPPLPARSLKQNSGLRFRLEMTLFTVYLETHELLITDQCID